MSDNQKLLALLIDGDNAQTELIPEILKAVREYGVLRIAKVFHNKATIAQWEQIASKHSIEPIWIPNNTAKKNSVDIALVMDAMILLYERKEITGFCIVTSDGDYTRLARYLKSQGKLVLGIGKTQTPEPLRNACTEFIYMEDLASAPTPFKQFVDEDEEIVSSDEEITDSDFFKAFTEGYKQLVEQGNKYEKDRVPLRDIKEAMKVLDPLFSTRTYRQMPKFINRVKILAEIYPDIITLIEEQDSKSTVHYIYITPTQPEIVGSEIEKFREAYRLAADVLKYKDSLGWVKLALIGETLRKLYPNYLPRIYRDTRYGQLKKVVEQMIVHYPNVIELKTDGVQPEIRIKK